MNPRIAIIFVVLLGCGQSASPPPAAVTPAPAQPVTLDTSRKDLVFRYLDPATGEVATASALDAIPAAARAEVVVYDPTVQLPAGWDLVANLASGATAVPREHFAFNTRAALTPSSAAPQTAKSAAHDVVMFSSQGCGYCAKARRFLTQNRVPFTELDIEEDPAAPARLGALGKKAGLGPRDLQGVPIIFVDGTPVLGWDQHRVASLLGFGG